MNDYGVRTDEHLSRLAEWVLNTIGKAFGWSLLVAGAIGVVAAFTHTWEVAWLGAVGGPLTFAAIMSGARAPYPSDD